jgi:bis(5'-nucleosidyl)-tetraphosphatase
MKEGKYRQAIFVVVYARTKDGIEYVVLKRKHHWKGWEFPKGGINPKEKMKHAVRREAREETGLRALSIKKFNYSGRYLYKKKFGDRTGIIGQTFSLYAAEVKKGKIKFDRHEHAGYEWLNFEQAVKRVTFNEQKKSLRMVNNYLLKDKK